MQFFDKLFFLTSVMCDKLVVEMVWYVELKFYIFQFYIYSYLYLTSHFCS